MTLLLIVVGIIMEKIPVYFHGQHGVGHVLLIVGLVLLAIEVIFWLLALGLVGGGAAATSKRHRRGF